MWFARLRRAIERPIEVGVSGKGIDAVTTELCVTAPTDAGGHARPRVLLGAFCMPSRPPPEAHTRARPQM